MENRKVKLTKRLLKEALIELLNKKDLNNITIKELCSLAELNRSTFYAHYQDIYQLLNEITIDMVSHIPFAEGINNYNIRNLEECIQYIQQNKKVYSVLLNQGLFQKHILKKSLEIFENNSLQNGAMKNCDIEYYEALSAYCIAGCEKFLLYCLDSSIPIKNQAIILYSLLENARKTVIKFSK